MTHPAPVVVKPAIKRYTALDGLRGLAACMVLLWHLYLLAQPYLAQQVTAIYATPVSFFFSGPEAVYVFFILSGFVLSLPVLTKGKNFDWANYYVSRLVRLYVPSAVSILLAAALLSLVMNLSVGPWVRNGWMLHNTVHIFEFPNVVYDVLLFPVYNSPFNNVLGTIRWEIYFSLLLPVLLGLLYLMRKVWYVGFIVIFAGLIIGVLSGEYQSMYQIYATFALGVFLAVHRVKIQQLFVRMLGKGKRAHIITVALLLVAVEFLIIAHTLPDIKILGVLTAVGALLFLMAALYIPAVAHFLDRRLMQFLGKISFSLYLVHVPIIVTLGYLYGPEHWYWAALTAVPVSFVVAIVFQRFVEAPSHRFAKFAGRWFPNKLRAMYEDIRTNGITVHKPNKFG